jgi:hypothetical protein
MCENGYSLMYSKAEFETMFGIISWARRSSCRGSLSKKQATLNKS